MIHVVPELRDGDSTYTQVIHGGINKDRQIQKKSKTEVRVLSP